MDIDKLADNYKPDANCIKVAKGSQLLFLIGVVSAGKDAIKEVLLSKYNYRQMVTYTTRPPRINSGRLEINGKEHYFVSFGQMAGLLQAHQMIEVNHFGDNFYGTSVNELMTANDSGKIILTDVDIHGAANFYNIAPDNMMAIFVVPPDYNVWMQRIEKRYESMGVFNDEWKTRREITISELETALQTPYFHFVINDDLDEVVDLVDKIAHHDEEILKLGDMEARNCASKLLEEIKQGP